LALSSIYYDRVLLPPANTAAAATAQVLQAAMLQQLAHARAEARQSQAQLEEANARAAAAAVAASSGPLTRAKNAEMAAKQTLEAAGKVGGAEGPDIIVLFRSGKFVLYG
jgi:multidrug efflux pump subunit AcrA (membrane-fusion protein)